MFYGRFVPHKSPKGKLKMEELVQYLSVVWDTDSKAGVFYFSTDVKTKVELKANNAAEFTAALLLLSRQGVKWDDKAKKLYTGDKRTE